MFLMSSNLTPFLISLLLGSLMLLPFYITLGYTAIPDALTRLSPNDTFLGTYYFWWTNLTYLPAFFFMLIIVGFGFLSKFRRSNILIAGLLLICLYATELVDYLSLNSTDSIGYYGVFGANTLLTNTLNRYHPLIFYSSAVLLIVPILVALGERVNRNSPFRFYHLIWIRSYFYYSTLVNLVALWLGSWWALQEGTWGGWWNWDSSEMFGLLVSFLALTIYHSTVTNTSYYNTLEKSLLSLLFLFWSYFFIQLNFDLVSHNFGSKFFFFFNNNLFFLQSVFLLSFGSYRIIQNLINRHVQTKVILLMQTIYRRESWIHYGRFLPAIVASYWILYSYRPLVNYFLWNFFELNLFNSEFSLQPVNFFAFIFLAIWLTSAPLSTGVLVIILMSNFTHWLFLPILFITYSSLFAWIHLSLLLLVISNFVVYDVTFVTWLSTVSDVFETSESGLNLLTPLAYTLDQFAVETTVIWSNASAPYASGWNIYSLSNAPAINFFSLDLSHNFLQNFYQLGLSYVIPTIYLELVGLPSVNLIFFITIIAFNLFIMKLCTKVEW